MVVLLQWHRRRDHEVASPHGRRDRAAGYRRWRRRLAVAGAVALATGAAAGGPLVFPAHAFPAPTGPQRIGTLTYHWVDADRPELLRPDPAARRELMAQVWYPAEPVPGAPAAPYLPDAGAVGAGMARQHGMPGFVLRGLGTARAHAVEAAPPVSDPAAHPVLVFLEGLTGYRQMNTFQVEDLVSHGYVVVALDQPDVAAEVVFPDGRRAGSLPARQLQALVGPAFGPVDPAPTLHGRSFPEGALPHLVGDVGFGLDRLAELNAADPHGLLTGRLDLARAGVFGVSLGGIVGAEACRLDPRLRACLILDAPMPVAVARDGLPQPAMWITRDRASMEREGWAADDVDEHQTTMQGAFEATQGSAYLVRVPGTFHGDFTDVVDVLPLVGIAGFAGPIGSRRAHDVVNAYTRAFFDRHLAGRPAPVLDEPADRHPDVLVQTRLPALGTSRTAPG